MLSDGCIFCGIVRGEVPTQKIYEDERTLAFLDINPSAPGHTLIIPKTHVTRVEELSPEDAGALFRTLHRLVGGIQEAVEARASSIGINNGPEAGQEVPHVHIHVIPRRRGDGGGIVQGLLRTKGRHGKEEMQGIASRIMERVG
ncbi:HIT family protein [Candidatus Bathyarchaeota archaeon]|nr:HIT family protein [Candidatus Bathyarchaeota archaeon]